MDVVTQIHALVATQGTSLMGPHAPNAVTTATFVDPQWLATPARMDIIPIQLLVILLTFAWLVLKDVPGVRVLVALVATQGTSLMGPPNAPNAETTAPFVNSQRLAAPARMDITPIQKLLLV